MSRGGRHHWHASYDIRRRCIARLMKVDDHLLLLAGVRALRHDAVHVCLPLHAHVVRPPVRLRLVIHNLSLLFNAPVDLQQQQSNTAHTPPPHNRNRGAMHNLVFQNLSNSRFFSASVTLAKGEGGRGGIRMRAAMPHTRARPASVAPAPAAVSSPRLAPPAVQPGRHNS
jgi:hypothetical protein